MENINETLKRFAGSEGFQKRFTEMRKGILNHPEIKAFLIQHEDELTQEMIEKNLSKLYEYSNQSKECQKCSSLDGCINLMKGYHPHLIISGGSIEVHYDKCPSKVMDDEKRKNEKLIRSLYVPKDILKASFDDMEKDEERTGAIGKALAFVLDYSEGKTTKGLYLYGQFGVGKSYLLGAIANELAQKKIQSMIVYVPELFRELKSSIGDSTLNEKLEAIKKEPILMLDDIGAETMSSWVRDEILGPILQYRMLDNLPTLFTSNYDFTGLEHHLTYSQRGEEERLKARRIMERIKYLTTPIFVTGKNRRN